MSFPLNISELLFFFHLMKFALLTTNLINPLCIKGSWNQVLLALLRIPANIYLLYPYKILRYWWPQISIYYPYKILRYCLWYLPLLLSPPYIYVQYFTQSYVNIQLISHMAYLIYRHYLSISLVLSLSYLSPYLFSNIYYIYNKYPIYLSLPYILYTHDHICSIFIVDYVNYLGHI